MVNSMDKPKKKIFVIVEGERTGVQLMKKLISLYPELDANYEIVPYRTNIYVFYNAFFASGEEPDSFEILQALKSLEKDEARKSIFDEKYTDILLIFDLEPQDGLFAVEKIRLMQDYFIESSDMGKLYLNYPMVEAFYHMTSIPDNNYNNKRVSIEELRQGTYKARVNAESKGHDYRKFIANRAECSMVIHQNLEKALQLQMDGHVGLGLSDLSLEKVLDTQLRVLAYGYVHVLCTCAFFLYDYNPNLLLP